MGLGVVLSLAIGAASTIAQVSSERQRSRAAKESRAISTASQLVRNRLERRKVAKERRVKAGRIIATAGASGAGGSSAALGAISALGTNTGARIAEQAGQATAAQGISAANQRAADAESRGFTIKAFSGALTEGFGVLDEAGIFD